MADVVFAFVWQAWLLQPEGAGVAGVSHWSLLGACPPNPPLVKLYRDLGQSQPQARRAPIRCELRAILSSTFASPTAGFTGVDGPDSGVALFHGGVRGIHLGEEVARAQH